MRRGLRKGTAPARPSPLPWATLRAGHVAALERLPGFSRTPLPPDSVDLSRQQPSDDLLPHEELRECLEAALRTEGARCLGYAHGPGLPRLRAAVAKDLTHDGIPVRPEEVVITNGSQQGIDLLARLLVDPGDAFLVEAATYPGTLRLLTVAGARLLAVRDDDEGPDLADLRRLEGELPKGLYLMPGLHNPMGTTITAERRAELVAWSHEAGVPIVEDDYDAELSLDGRPTPPRLRALDPEVCHVGTYSKKLIPALRIGYLLCPEPIRAQDVSLKSDQDNGTSGLLQLALAEFLERGHLRKHLVAVTRAYRERRDALECALRTELPAGISWRQPERGLFLWIPLPPGLPPDAVAEEARRQGVQVTSSTAFALRAGECPGIRVTYCRERPERLAEGARRLGAAIRAVAARAAS